VRERFQDEYYAEFLDKFQYCVHIFSEINGETNKSYTSVMIQLFK